MTASKLSSSHHQLLSVRALAAYFASFPPDLNKPKRVSAHSLSHITRRLVLSRQAFRARSPPYQKRPLILSDMDLERGSVGGWLLFGGVASRLPQIQQRSSTSALAHRHTPSRTPTVQQLQNLPCAPDIFLRTTRALLVFSSTSCHCWR